MEQRANLWRAWRTILDRLPRCRHYMIRQWCSICAKPHRGDEQQGEETE